MDNSALAWRRAVKITAAAYVYILKDHPQCCFVRHAGFLVKLSFLLSLCVSSRAAADHGRFSESLRPAICVDKGFVTPRSRQTDVFVT